MKPKTSNTQLPNENPMVVKSGRRPKQMAQSRLLKPADLSLEVVVLLFAGMAMLILGLLLFPVYAGILPYYENGLFGMMLVAFAPRSYPWERPLSGTYRDRQYRFTVESSSRRWGLSPASFQASWGWFPASF